MYLRSISVSRKRILRILGSLGILLVVTSLVAYLYGAPPVSGSKMLRIYAPDESDFGYMYRSGLSLGENPASDQIRVECHFYIVDMITSGTDNKFDVFMFVDEGFLWQWYYTYGAQIVLSQGETTARLFVSNPISWLMPTPVFVDYVTTGQWYNLTQVHYDSWLAVWLNGGLMWNKTEGVSANPVDINILRHGELEGGQHGVTYAYDMYVDYLNVTGTEDFIEDFETNLANYDITKTANAKVELVTETQDEGLGPVPGEIFDAWPSTQNGTYNTILTYYGTVYNNYSAVKQYLLDIRSVTGDPWTWELELPSFKMDPYESKTVRIWCYIPTSGDSSTATFRLTAGWNSSLYWEDACQAVSTGWEEGQVPGSPVGPAPVLTTGVFNTFLAFTFSLMCAAIGFGLVKGESPEPALFFFLVGQGITYFLGWLPDWIFVCDIAFLAILLAHKFTNAFGGSRSGA